MLSNNKKSVTLIFAVLTLLILDTSDLNAVTSANAKQCTSYHYENIKGPESELFEILIIPVWQTCPPPSDFNGTDLELEFSHRSGNTTYYDNLTHGNKDCVIEQSTTYIEDGGVLNPYE
jgi:hypothetical protein